MNIEQLKNRIRITVTGILKDLGDEYCKCDADRFSNICSDCEHITTIINECEEINWDEGL